LVDVNNHRFTQERIMNAQARQTPLAAELEAVVVAAEQQLRALAGENPLDAVPLTQALADAATAAIASGHPIAAVAQAEQRGQQQARTALSRELLARVERGARRRREAEHDLHRAIRRAARLGLPQRDIASAAQLAHATIRTIVTRGNDQNAPVQPESNRVPIGETA
jgi:hypothetical protein